MTLYLLDPTKGLQFTANGEDVQLFDVEDDEYILHLLAVTLRQFQGEWRYDKSQGIPYLQEILGHAPLQSRLQQIFTLAISRYVPVNSLTVNIEDDQINVSAVVSGGLRVEIRDLLAPPPLADLLYYAKKGSNVSVKLRANISPQSSFASLLIEDATLVSSSFSGDTLLLVFTEPFLGRLTFLNADGEASFEGGDLLRGFSFDERIS